MTKKRKGLSPIQAGIAGEYFVAAELTRRGYVASITLRNTRGIDILASNADATKSVGIQVKTSQGPAAAWMMSKKAEADLADNLYYIFVRLPSDGAPAYHVVPRREVAHFVRQSHARWLATPGRGGKAHRDNDLRQYVDSTHEYENRWELLGLD